MNLLLLLAARNKSSQKSKTPIHLNTAGISSEIKSIYWPVVTANDSNVSAGINDVVSGIDWWVQPILGENKFVNSGFENGIDNYSIHDSSNGFYGTVSATSAPGEFHSGSGAVKLVSGTTDRSVITRFSQDCVTIPGKKYVLKLWAKGDGVNMAHFFVYDRTTGLDITPQPVPLAGLSTEWKQFTYAFTAQEGQTLVRSVFYAPYVIGGTVWYDDLYFGEALPTPIDTHDNVNSAGISSLITDITWNLGPTELSFYENASSASLSNVITGIVWNVEQPNIWESYNPDFESDFDNWIKNDATNGNHGTASIATGAGEYYSGSKSCKLVGDANSNYNTDPWIHRDTILSPSTNYKLSFYTKGDGVNAGMIFIHDKTTNTYITPTDVSTGISGTTWQKFEYDFSTPAGASNVRIFLESSGKKGSVVYFDECKLSLR